MSGNDELTWLDATAQAELVAKGAVTLAEWPRPRSRGSSG